VRYADVRGYSYDREDVTGRGLASVYAQSLGAVFTAEQKPFEVELTVAEVGSDVDHDHLFRLTFDGSIADERRFVVMGGAAERVAEAVIDGWTSEASFGEAIRLAARALREDRTEPLAFEVAVLDRDSETTRGSRRAFRRVFPGELDGILDGDDALGAPGRA
jgi:proteasome alpha subunit